MYVCEGKYVYIFVCVSVCLCMLCGYLYMCVCVCMYIESRVYACGVRVCLDIIFFVSIFLWGFCFYFRLVGFVIMKETSSF